MKILNFLNFRKKKELIISSENLYSEINSEEEQNFINTHNACAILKTELKYLERVMNSDNFLKNFLSIISNSDMDYLSDNQIVIDTGYYGLPKNKIQKKILELSINTRYQIRKFDDDWFILNIVKADGYNSSYWRYKCDTIEGVAQLLLKYQYYNGIPRYHS